LAPACYGDRFAAAPEHLYVQPTGSAQAVILRRLEGEVDELWSCVGKKKTATGCKSTVVRAQRPYGRRSPAWMRSRPRSLRIRTKWTKESFLQPNPMSSLSWTARRIVESAATTPYARGSLGRGAPRYRSPRRSAITLEPSALTACMTRTSPKVQYCPNRTSSR
jgi:hypothetical protein